MLIARMLGAAVLLCAAACRGFNQKTAMPFDKLEFQIGEISETPELLEIEGSGRARFTSYFSSVEKGSAEVGVYGRQLTSEEMNAVRSLLERPAVEEMPDQSGRVLSGDRYRRLRVARRGETIEKLVGTEDPVDPRLERVLNGLEELMTKLKAHPIRTVEMRVTNPSVGPQRNLTAIVTFANRGVEPATLCLPLDGRSRLSIEVWPNLPEAELDNVDPIVVQAAEVKPTSSRPGDAAVIVLSPKTSQAVHAKFPLASLRSGKYMVRFEALLNARSIDKPACVGGQLAAAAIAISIP